MYFIYQSYLLFVLIFIGKLLVIYHGFLATSASKENFFTRIYLTISNDIKLLIFLINMHFHSLFFSSPTNLITVGVNVRKESGFFR